MVTGSQKISKLINLFTQSSQLHYQASLDGDFRTANKQVSKINKIHKSLIKFGQDGRDALLALVEDKDPSVAAMAAAYSLKHNPETCIRVLKCLSSRPDLLGFQAKHALIRWNKGEWKIE